MRAKAEKKVQKSWAYTSTDLLKTSEVGLDEVVQFFPWGAGSRSMGRLYQGF